MGLIHPPHPMVQSQQEQYQYSQLQAGRKGRTSESCQQAPEGGAQALSAVDVQGGLAIQDASDDM